MNALKTFFVWLLLSVVPLQRMAVNAAMTCKAVRQNLQLMQEAAHAHDATMHPCVGRHDEQDEPVEPDGSCSTHHASTLWLHIDKITLPAVANLPDLISYIAFHVPFVVPDRLERPPRRLSF